MCVIVILSACCKELLSGLAVHPDLFIPHTVEAAVPPAVFVCWQILRLYIKCMSAVLCYFSWIIMHLTRQIPEITLKGYFVWVQMCIWHYIYISVWHNYNPEHVHVSVTLRVNNWWLVPSVKEATIWSLHSRHVLAFSPCSPSKNTFSRGPVGFSDIKNVRLIRSLCFHAVHTW